ncbi:MAG TPA: MBL fold metallo-hydrolase [Pseudogracilibacillus sp.]|nr:MBL fold metallo-hydrolase [Pseudogracilibacillus sp.]
MITKVKAPEIYPVVIETEAENLRSFNFYIVKNEGKLFLVDAGFDDEVSWKHLLKTLSKNGFSLKDLDAILLTHSHFDHIGLVNKVTEQHDIPVYVHKDALVRLKRDPDFFKRRVKFFNSLYTMMGVEAHLVEMEEARLHWYGEHNERKVITDNIHTLKEGDRIFGFDVYEVPGHALDHIVFHHKETETLLVGDHVIKHMSSNALVDMDIKGNRLKSLITYEKSLERMYDIPTKIAYSGHGETITNMEKTVDKKLERINKKGELILQLLYQPRTPADVAKEIYKDRYESVFPLIMSEVIGHIDRLVYKGRIKYTVKDGVYYYERARRKRL